MDTHLKNSPSGFLVGDRLTIADISCWGWVASASTFLPTPLHYHVLFRQLTVDKEWSGVDMAEFPELDKWLFKLLERPGFEKGRNVPTPHKAFDQRKQTEEQLEAQASGSKAWIQKTMKAEAEGSKV